TDPAGIADLAARLGRLGPSLVVLEATGGYEADALAALLAAGIPTAVVNPRRVRQFAAGIGQHAKTDPIDAAVLAHFAAVVAPPPAAPADPDRVVLAALLDRRRQLPGTRVAEGNRLRPGPPAAVREGMAALAVARVPGPLRDFAHRLKAKGKPSKVALIAVARKLLRIANAVIRDSRAWDPKMAADA